jgi:hypothetical protein
MAVMVLFETRAFQWPVFVPFGHVGRATKIVIFFLEPVAFWCAKRFKSPRETLI